MIEETAAPETVVTETPAAEITPSPVPTPLAPAAPLAPEDFEIATPEGLEVTDEYKSELKAYAKEHGLNAEQASKLMARDASILSKIKDHQAQAHEKMVYDTWVSELKNDPAIGGEKFTENMELAKRVMQKYATPEFIKELGETGHGNNPGLVRFCVALGRAAASDAFVTGKTGAIDSRSIEERMYPSMKK